MGGGARSLLGVDLADNQCWHILFFFSFLISGAETFSFLW